MKTNFIQVAALLTSIMMTSTAEAVVVHWALNNATTTDGQTLTGSFDFDADTNLYSNINVTNSGSVYWAPVTFTGTSNPGASYLAEFFNGTFTAASTSLWLWFPTLLTNAGGSVALDTTSAVFLHCSSNNCSGGAFASGAEIVYFTGGQVTSVPEPEAWITMLAGLGMLGSIMYRRQSPN